MAFIQANFSPIGGNAGRGSSPQRFSYKTADTHATVDTSGYFNSVSSLVEPGDIIDVVVVAALGASPEVVSTYGSHIVLTNASGVVDVSNVTAGVVTNTD